jgi:hypothetical protein
MDVEHTDLGFGSNEIIGDFPFLDLGLLVVMMNEYVIAT